MAGLPTRILAVAWILGFAMLFCPASIAGALAILDFRNQNRTWIGPVSLVALSLWIVSCIPHFQATRRRKANRAAILLRLRSLSVIERQILEHCLQNGTQAIHFNTLDHAEAIPSADMLASKGLLVHTPGSTWLNVHDYVIPDFVWDHITSNPEGFLR